MSPPTIVLATRNLGKLKEIQKILADWPVGWKTLRDYPEVPEAAEAAEDYLSNAREKARLAAEHSGEWALADDSGLEVEALGGVPGVRSARYAGPDAADADNWKKLLEDLQGVPLDRRRAVFRCVVVLRHPDGREHHAAGELWGHISKAPRGINGFGYDPIFVPEGLDSCMAELEDDEKNRISHRYRALQALKAIPDLEWKGR